MGSKYTPQRAIYETQLARAHRALYKAAAAADALNDLGAEEDCHGIMAEVLRLSEDSLRGKPRKMIRGQTSLADFIA